MRNWIRAVGVAIILLAGASGILAQTAAQKQKLTIEQLIDIKHPSEPIW
jgi:purine nucleoside phosphorylase